MCLCVCVSMIVCVRVCIYSFQVLLIQLLFRDSFISKHVSSKRQDGAERGERLFPFRLHLLNNYLMLFVDRIRLCIAFAESYLTHSLPLFLSLSTNLPHMFQIKMANELKSQLESRILRLLIQGSEHFERGIICIFTYETIYLYVPMYFLQVSTNLINHNNSRLFLFL